MEKRASVVAADPPDNEEPTELSLDLESSMPPEPIIEPPNDKPKLPDIPTACENSTPPVPSQPPCEPPNKERETVVSRRNDDALEGSRTVISAAASAFQEEVRPAFELYTVLID